MLARRTVIGGAVAAPALLTFGRAGAVTPEPLFTLGVASGEPTPDGMVLWTRLAPRPLQGDGGLPDRRIPVRWEIFADDAARTLVKTGDAVADPAFGHSVHVEVARLAPHRPYWFRFVANGQASALGRTRTAPARDTVADRLRFCFASCQKYESGRYGAWANAVADDPDLILFLGDYIYEGNPARDVLRPHLNPEPFDLAGYRIRHATYRLDPQLQAAHAIAPWLVTWDDHEAANDYAGFLDQHNGDPAVFARRRAAAYRAYYEFMPLRRSQRFHGGELRLYRAVDWGRLAQFQIIDDRQYRDGRPCQPPGSVAAHIDKVTYVSECAERTDPRRSMLGARQEKWLGEALGRTRSSWNVLAQQTDMTPYPRRDPLKPAGPQNLHGTDTWQGYPATRERILARWRDAAVSNPLVIGGDIHGFVASELSLADRRIAPAFVGGSISSLASDRLLKQNTASLPAYRFADNSVRGYGRIDLTPARAEVTFRAVRNALDPFTAAYDLAKFTVENGDPRVLT